MFLSLCTVQGWNFAPLEVALVACAELSLFGVISPWYDQGHLHRQHE